jgi:hypothetical protein
VQVVAALLTTPVPMPISVIEFCGQLTQVEPLLCELYFAAGQSSHTVSDTSVPSVSPDPTLQKVIAKCNLQLEPSMTLLKLPNAHDSHTASVEAVPTVTPDPTGQNVTTV